MTLLFSIFLTPSAPTSAVITPVELWFWKRSIKKGYWQASKRERELLLYLLPNAIMRRPRSWRKRPAAICWNRFWTKGCYETPGSRQKSNQGPSTAADFSPKPWRVFFHDMQWSTSFISWNTEETKNKINNKLHQTNRPTAVTIQNKSFLTIWAL